MSLIGTTIKPFETQAFKEGKFLTVTDADTRGKWAVFFFYPADFTFVCPTELEDLADHYETFQKMGVEIYSVSTDTHFSHKAWHDSSPAIGQALADRGTFVVDPDGVIQLMEVTSEGVGRNAVELLRKIKAAQYIAAHPGEVCPAKWEEGETTLAPSLDLVGKI